MLVPFFFYFYAAVMLISALMVISTKNSVHAVLFLILTFFSAAALFVLLGAEFLAMTLIIVYVGAVMVLFLFVVMMLDIDFSIAKQGFMKYAPIGAAVGCLLLFMLISMFSLADFEKAKGGGGPLAFPIDKSISNTESLGRILYTDYALIFELIGIILLVAMIGAIVLTLHHRTNIKRQNIPAQVARNKENSIEMIDVGSGQTGH